MDGRRGGVRRNRERLDTFSCKIDCLFRKMWTTPSEVEITRTAGDRGGEKEQGAIHATMIKILWMTSALRRMICRVLRKDKVC